MEEENNSDKDYCFLYHGITVLVTQWNSGQQPLHGESALLHLVNFSNTSAIPFLLRVSAATRRTLIAIVLPRDMLRAIFLILKIIYISKVGLLDNLSKLIFLFCYQKNHGKNKIK